MTNHSNDSADENDGKYSTDQQMTFDSLLKTSLRERAEHEQTLSDSGDNQQQSFESKSGKKTTPAADDQEREESASNQRTALATSIGEAHVSDRRSKLAGGETKAIGHHTTYELARTTINNQTYYYVAQITDQSYERHHAQLAIKDFGTAWSYDIPEPNQEVLQHAIGDQRQRDIQMGQDPVKWLSDAQLDQVSEWYRSRTGLKFHSFEERHRKDEEKIHVIDQYLVADLDKELLLSGGDLQELTDRQITVLFENLLEIVHPNVDLVPTLGTDLGRRIEYPLLARITFDD